MTRRYRSAAVCLVAFGLLSGSAAGARPLAQQSLGCPALLELDREVIARVESGEIATTFESLPGGQLKKGTAVLTIDAPVESLVEVLYSYDSYVEFMPYIADIRARTEQGDRVVYQLLDLPFPIANRHYEIRVRLLDSTIEVPSELASGPFTHCVESHWVYEPGSGNIDDTWGRWEMLMRGDGSMLVAYVAWIDPGGLVPAWVQNWAQRHALPKLVGAVRDEIVRRREP